MHTQTRLRFDNHVPMKHSDDESWACNGMGNLFAHRCQLELKSERKGRRWSLQCQQDYQGLDLKSRRTARPMQKSIRYWHLTNQTKIAQNRLAMPNQ